MRGDLTGTGGEHKAGVVPAWIGARSTILLDVECLDTKNGIAQTEAG